MTADPMADLIERLNHAAKQLTGMAQRAKTSPEQERIAAKATGVMLALSYAREYAKAEADLRRRVTAWARDCVTHGDLTPAGERALLRILGGNSE